MASMLEINILAIVPGPQIHKYIKYIIQILLQSKYSIWWVCVHVELFFHIDWFGYLLWQHFFSATSASFSLWPVILVIPTLWGSQCWHSGSSRCARLIRWLRCNIHVISCLVSPVYWFWSPKWGGPLPCFMHAWDENRFQIKWYGVYWASIKMHILYFLIISISIFQETWLKFLSSTCVERYWFIACLFGGLFCFSFILNYL